MRRLQSVPPEQPYRARFLKDKFSQEERSGANFQQRCIKRSSWEVRERLAVSRVSFTGTAAEIARQDS